MDIARERGTKRRDRHFQIATQEDASRPATRAQGTDTLPHFVRLPMTDKVFKELILRLQSSDEFAYRALDSFSSADLFLTPDWFPRPDEAEVVCSARDESSWPVLVVRGRDGFTYLHLN